MSPAPREYDRSSRRSSQTAREGRVFALTLSGGFAFIALIAYRKGAHVVVIAALTIASVALLAALFVPGRLGPARTTWLRIGEAIGSITTPILMALVYYLIVTPAAVVRRATTKRRVASDSNWHRRPPPTPASRMERQF